MGFALRSPASALIIALFALGSAGHAATPKEIGYVADLEGNWIDLKYGQSLLGIGDPVDSDSKVSRRSDKKSSDFLHIRFSDGRMVEFSCQVKLVCEGNLDIRRNLAASKAGLLDFMTPQVLEVLRSRYPALIRTLARSASENDLPDTLIISRNGVLDLSIPLNSLKPDQYRIELRRVKPADPQGDGEPDASFDLGKVGNAVQVRQAPTVTAGLYRVRIYRKDPRGELSMVPQEPWWLVRPSLRDDISGKFIQVQTRTEAWRKQGDEGAGVLLRAYLLHLSETK